MKIYCIANRLLAQKAYWQQVESILAAGVDAFVLREKTLNSQQYLAAARQALALCQRYETACILHQFSSIAETLGVTKFHCSLPYLQQHPEIKNKFQELGVSIHTSQEARRAAVLGATYIMVGHVFPTACKPDSPPVGLLTLSTICRATPLPVYALGGITPQTISRLKALPLAGVAVMSGLMSSAEPRQYLRELRTAL